MQNLERRPSGIYVARLTVPTRLRAIVGAQVLVANTGGRSLAVAKLVASEQIARWRRHLFDLERLTLQLRAACRVRSPLPSTTRWSGRDRLG